MTFQKKVNKRLILFFLLFNLFIFSVIGDTAVQELLKRIDNDIKAKHIWLSLRSRADGATDPNTLNSGFVTDLGFTKFYFAS